MSEKCDKIAFLVSKGFRGRNPEGLYEVMIGDANGKFTVGSKLLSIIAYPLLTPDGRYVTYGGIDQDLKLWWVVEAVE